LTLELGRHNITAIQIMGVKLGQQVSLKLTFLNCPSNSLA